MAERRSFFSRLFTGIGNLFRGRRAPPPEPEYPFGRLPAPPPEPVPTGPFGFPQEEEAYPVEPGFQQVDAYTGAYPPAGQYVIQGNEDYWGTKEFWAREVESNDGGTMEARYGVSNKDIIDMLIAQGAWDNEVGSEDWARFRQEYARQFGTTMNRYSTIYGR